jgi:hypothetical protein
MAKGDWWFKFEIPVWRNSPELRKCSLATRGFWIDCLAIMRDQGKAVIKGTYDEIARSVGCFPLEAEASINELKHTKTADVTQINGCVMVKSRRYARELKAKEMNKLRVRRHRVTHSVTVEKRLRVKSNKKEVRKEEEKRGAEAAPKKPPSRSAKQVKLPTRIPDPFPITPEMWAWLAENIPDLDDPNAMHANFIEYWTNAKQGKAEKINWILTWQKGMRLAKKWQDEKHGKNGNHNDKTRRESGDSSAGTLNRIRARPL